VRGGGVQPGGVGPATWGKPSKASDRYDQLASELEQLAAEHADQIRDVERTVAEAEAGVGVEYLRREAKLRADALRLGVAGLPLPGATPGSARAAAALAREYAGSMAESLERLELRDAVRSGREAWAALRQARRKARGAKSPENWLDQAALGEASQRLGEELGWAEATLEQIRRRTEVRARRALDSAGKREQGFSRRAGNLASRSRISETALPHDITDQLERASNVMREAARELDHGKGQRGLKLQREAQRLLEQSRTGQTTSEDSAREHEDRDGRGATGGRRMRSDGNVPDAESSQRAEQFKRRVLEGLSGKRAGRLAPAVKRYAEGLLR
jgi:hypothetical protein